MQHGLCTALCQSNPFITPIPSHVNSDTWFWPLLCTGPWVSVIQPRIRGWVGGGYKVVELVAMQKQRCGFPAQRCFHLAIRVHLTSLRLHKGFFLQVCLLAVNRLNFEGYLCNYNTAKHTFVLLCNSHGYENCFNNVAKPRQTCPAGSQSHAKTNSLFANGSLWAL